MASSGGAGAGAGAVGGSVRQLDRVYNDGTIVGLSESQLLDRFVGRRDDAAFEALVVRHGPMVQGVCRQFLRDPNDVDDAVQATFLVLARKAGSLRRREQLGNWLYGVAYRVSLRARSLATKRSQSSAPSGEVERLAAASRADAPGGALAGDDASIHEELGRLPDKYRAPVVLCYLEGLTHEEAADRLGWPLGTVKGRLARARDLLRSRLTRRGLTLTSALAAVERLTVEARASVILSERLAALTVQAALGAAAGRSLVGVVPAAVLTLTEGVSRAMSLSQLKSVASMFAVAGLITTGACVHGYQTRSTAALAASISDDQAPEKGTPGKLVVKHQEKPTRPPGVPAPASASASGLGRANVGPGMQAGGGGIAGMMGFPAPAVAPGAVAVDPLDGLDPEARLRVVISELAPRVAKADPSPRTKEILTQLELAVDMAFPNETPLEDVLKYIESATEGPKGNGIPIYVDPIGLQEVERTTTSPVTLRLKGVALKTTLRLTLKQLGLAYCVKDGILFISSPLGVYQELLEGAEGSSIMEGALKAFSPAPVVPPGGGAGGGFR